MDGRPLLEAFSDPLEPTLRGSSYRQLPAESVTAAPVYTAAEESELKERLRALGYIE